MFQRLWVYKETPHSENISAKTMLPVSYHASLGSLLVYAGAPAEQK